MNNSNNLAQIVSSLGSRNFRLFYLGQGISLTGSWMTHLATSWLIYSFTNSSLLLGLSAIASSLPNIAISLFSGVLIERWNFHRVLIITQSLSMIQSFLLAILTLTGIINEWWLILMLVLQGIINGFDIPSRLALLPNLLEDKSKLPNAIALNAAMFSLTRMIGPAIAGVIMTIAGAGVCFLIDGISYGAVIISLFMLQIPTLSNNHKPITNFRKDLLEGLTYSYQTPLIRIALLCLALTTFFGLSITFLLPAYVKQNLAGEVNGFGILMAISGIGSFLGATYLASQKNLQNYGIMITRATILLGLIIVLLSISYNFDLSILAIFCFAILMSLVAAGSNTIIQSQVADDKRARVMSILTLVFNGSAPLGSLFLGWLISNSNIPIAITISGICCTLWGLYLSSHPHSFKKL